MLRSLNLFGLLCLSALATAQTTPPATQPPAAKESDVKSVKSIVAAVYDVISGPAGQKRDWARMRSLFAPDAVMLAIVKTRSGEMRRVPMKVEDYIEKSGPVLESRGFFEKEVSNRTEEFGGLAHVWSTYESREKLDDAKPFQRGINSIQLWNDGKRWWVLSIVWQGEDPTTPLPDKYLKGGN